MRAAHLDDMVKGWFVGAFSPSLLATDQFEVAIKHYRSGDVEAAHIHRVATEITAVVSGKVRMFGADWRAGDIVLIEPGEATSFVALTDAVTVVVKTPCVAGDKFPAA